MSKQQNILQLDTNTKRSINSSEAARIVNMFFMLLLLSIVVAVVYYVTLYPVDNPVPGEYEVVFMSKACLNFNPCFR